MCAAHKAHGHGLAGPLDLSAAEHLDRKIPEKNDGVPPDEEAWERAAKASKKKVLRGQQSFIAELRKRAGKARARRAS